MSRKASIDFNTIYTTEANKPSTPSPLTTTESIVCSNDAPNSAASVASPPIIINSTNSARLSVSLVSASCPLASKVSVLNVSVSSAEISISVSMHNSFFYSLSSLLRRLLIYLNFISVLASERNQSRLPRSQSSL